MAKARADTDSRLEARRRYNAKKREEKINAGQPVGKGSVNREKSKAVGQEEAELEEARQAVIATQAEIETYAKSMETAEISPRPDEFFTWSPRRQALWHFQEIIRIAQAGGEFGMHEAYRHLCRTNLFFLLFSVLGRADANRDWIYDRCMEVEKNPNGYIDLWSRAHYKSSLITFAKTIQDILINPNITIGIFSHTRPIAKTFLRQIKREFETNDILKRVFPDILYENPNTPGNKWSEDDGLVVKRQANPKEGTVESWGLVDGQPTSRHFDIMVYDDVVTLESVSSPDMIKKTTAAWEMSLNLLAENGHSRYVGTFYHKADTYRTIIDRGAAVPRIYPCTVDGTPEGEPVLLTREQLDKKRRDMGPSTYATQMLLNPVALDVAGFHQSWLRYWRPSTTALSLYILCDPANEKKKTSDYTSFMVVGLGADQNYYILDMVRDRLNLPERAAILFDLHRRYRPRAVGYEKYGKDSDIQHYEDLMARENYRFQITSLGGKLSKNDRIRKLIPLFEQGRVFIPEALNRVNYEGKSINLIHEFVQEYLDFPVAAHDDMLDSFARILEPDFRTTFPISAGAPFTIDRGKKSSRFRVVRRAA